MTQPTDSPADTGIAAARARREAGETSPPDSADAQTPLSQLALAARVIIGVAGAIALVLIAVNTSSTFADAEEARLEISAVQVIQVYSEGLFWMVFTVGLVVAGYIASKLVP